MLWAEDMAQVAECLSNKLKNLSSNPRKSKTNKQKNQLSNILLFNLDNLNIWIILRNIMVYGIIYTSELIILVV
jgi:hypothetical protein